jgi:hypothetical protein
LVPKRYKPALAWLRTGCQWISGSSLPSGPRLSGGTLCLRKCVAVGGVRLLGAHIGGDLDATGALLISTRFGEYFWSKGFDVFDERKRTLEQAMGEMRQLPHLLKKQPSNVASPSSSAARKRTDGIVEFASGEVMMGSNGESGAGCRFRTGSLLFGSNLGWLSKFNFGSEH